MPRTAVLSKDNQTNGSSKESETNRSNGFNGSNSSNGSDKKHGGYRINSVLTPEMIQEPYSVDFADGMDSYDFAREKCSRQIIDPLKFPNEKEWLAFAKDCWGWKESKLDREAEAEADHLLEKLRNLIAETENKPKLAQSIKDKVADVIES